jgi:hypothetical protein
MSVLSFRWAMRHIWEAKSARLMVLRVVKTSNLHHLKQWLGAHQKKNTSIKRSAAVKNARTVLHATQCVTQRALGGRLAAFMAEQLAPRLSNCKLP